jgi:23S rRNA pseudouridine1911/1915/1917 synthase
MKPIVAEPPLNANPATPSIARDERVPQALAGRRLDQALASMFPEHSRSRLSAWIKSGQVLVDGAPAKPKHTVVGGQRVEIAALADPQVEFAPEAIALSLLYEDRDVLVINKPAGLVVHPGAGNRAGTLQNALLHHDPELARVPRAGIVHRLDKDTSGAMVVARTLTAHTHLVAQLAAREVHRQYEALVYGALVSGGTVDAPIARHPHDRLKMAVVEGGRPAITHYRVRERFRAHTLLQVNLETGRTHQIRVHMAHLRHPLVGDPVYSTGRRIPPGASNALIDALRGFRRQALHAEHLEFAHPMKKKTIAVDAPRPADMIDLLNVLATDAGG